MIDNFGPDRFPQGLRHLGRHCQQPRLLIKPFVDFYPLLCHLPLNMPHSLKIIPTYACLWDYKVGVTKFCKPHALNLVGHFHLFSSRWGFKARPFPHRASLADRLGEAGFPSQLFTLGSVALVIKTGKFVQKIASSKLYIGFDIWKEGYKRAKLLVMKVEKICNAHSKGFKRYLNHKFWTLSYRRCTKVD